MKGFIPNMDTPGYPTEFGPITEVRQIEYSDKEMPARIMASLERTGLSKEQAFNAYGQMQQDGILFREYRNLYIFGEATTKKKRSWRKWSLYALATILTAAWFAFVGYLEYVKT